MRALWCCLVLLTVLAPAGSVGITAAPTEAEMLLTAHRAAPGTHVERREQLETIAPPVLRPSTLLGTIEVWRDVAPVQCEPPRVGVTPANPRAPPA